MSSTSFLGSNNKNIMFMHYDTGHVGVGAYNPACKLDVAGDTTVRSNLAALGTVAVSGVASFSNVVNMLTTATFSNTIVMGSNNGSVFLATSNNYLGVLTAAPTEALDVTGKVKASSQFLAPITDSETLPGFTFSDDSNTGMFHLSNDTLGFTTAGVGRVYITDSGLVGVGTSNPGYTLDVRGDACFTGDLTVAGQLSVSNVTYIYSNIYVYSSETIQSNLTVSGYVGVSNIATFSSNVTIIGNTQATGIATFSNLVRMGSNSGTVELSTSNSLLGINLSGAPRAHLDISNGNILSRNIQRLSKSADNSNPLSITINWDKGYSNADLYFIVADVYQTIANGPDAGFRTQRIGVGVSNSTLAWTQAVQVFGSSNAYPTLDLVASANTSNSITLQSSTSWATTGDCSHGLNVDVVHFPYTPNIGNLYLS